MEIIRLKPPKPEFDAVRVWFDADESEWFAKFKFGGRTMMLCTGFFSKKDEKVVKEVVETLKQLIFHAIPSNTSRRELVPEELALIGSAIGPEDVLEQEQEAIKEYREHCHG